jgi:hypothetical protein
MHRIGRVANALFGGWPFVLRFVCGYKRRRTACSITGKLKLYPCCCKKKLMPLPEPPRWQLSRGLYEVSD